MIAYALGITLLAWTPAEAPGGSWLGWHGCWRAVEENAGRVVCLVPGSSAGEMVRHVIVDGATRERNTLRPDGVPIAVEEGGCKGTESSRWSQDGRRVFIIAQLDCEGVKRVSSSVLAMVAENEWVDVQTVSVGEQHAARVVRYRATSVVDMPAEITAALNDGRGLAREAARLHLTAPLEIADVVEAAKLLPAPAVEALLAERKAGFGLNAQKLVQLEKAGIAKSVIDVMVALSYPRTFVINDTQVETRAAPAQRGGIAYGGYGMCDYSYGRYYSPFAPGFGFDYDDCYDYNPYNRYGWSSRYGRNYNSGYYGWRTGPVVVIVRPDEGDEVYVPGSVRKGSGYTRGTGNTTNTSTARTRDTGDSGGRASAGSSTTSGTSSGTSSGKSSGSTSTGRTAIPRGSSGGGGSN